MPKKLLHRHSGVGQIETGSGKLTNVSYEITEYGDVISAASHDDPNATIEGLKSFQGWIETKDASMLPSEKMFLLYLANGKRLKILPTLSTGSHADVVGSGGLF